MDIKKITTFSMLLALSVVLGLAESMIPILNGVIPGVKLGLANTVVLFVIYTYSFKDALYISITRVILISILRTGLFSLPFFFSISGAVLSVSFMYLFKRFTKLSIVGVSIIGAVSHSVGQILMAMVIVKTFSVIYYLPTILIVSIPTGIIVGLAATEVLRFYEKV